MALGGRWWWKTIRPPARCCDDCSSRRVGRSPRPQNGRIGLERVAASPPDLILLDLMMPELDGFGFVERLRAEPAWRTIPVLVITAKDLTVEDRLRLNGWVERILQKGAYTRDRLLGEVRGLVRAVLGPPT